MTFAEFEQLPDPPDARLELRNGEPTRVPPPKWKHLMMEERLRSLLATAAGTTGLVTTEAGFRVAPTEYRIADVVFIRNERAGATNPDGYFEGAPDLVIEVLSPSNTAAEMIEKEALCLEHGSREYWLVDLDRRQVRVSTPDGRSITYKSGQEIPLFFDGRLAVDAIFS
jgi:Uma2 family endonuclease